MKIKNIKYFGIGVGILIFLILSYFIKIPIESGTNYLITDSLLGILIFHNLYILIIYSLVAMFLIWKSLKWKNQWKFGKKYLETGSIQQLQ